MPRGARAFSLALAAVGVVGLGVSGPGSAQDAAGNQAGAVVATPPPSVSPGAPAPSLAKAPPPETAPTVAPTVSADDNEDSNETSTDSADNELASQAVPLGRPRYTTAVLQALDKVTAETLRFEVKVGEPVRYKDLVITVHDCETSATNEAPQDSIVHMDVQYQPAVLGGGASVVRQVFRGWMFAQSPGLHPFVSPIYDVWVIACKTPAPPDATASTPASGASL